MKELSPSILSAELSNIKQQLEQVKAAGIKYLHIDVMDGLFVPNITIGQPYIKSLRKLSDLIFDVHLMIEKPERYIESFAEAGADILTIHYEACTHLDRALHQIKDNGMKAGVTINPSTPINILSEVLPIADLVLVMSVNPGFGGQSFIENSVSKLEWLKEVRQKENYNYIIEVDGGVKTSNIEKISNAGAELFVAGSAVFNDKDIKENIDGLYKKIR
ncbi:ribulose-phosphate 3-epimerase [Criibacterium bergeronii]|uniref:Ribulose-phosphate 3-epimerase n=1 Tax=Criibacterium bergeronii TaxID=1871336 RepID=A0A371INB2_9FIRM|nr:ribulose-phosphate 3-epimerase [Criibacterium bergeronii]MBS6062612.1 ribulose-phosphate 3-epimerase [Peptostreptococcaceae bacterium]RDY21967.1 ribulose-phosphate 3-epimerase [Criibacterium bergeronii]